MKVLLIQPPAPNIIRESLPAVVEDETGVYPPLGLLYIAAHAAAVEGVEVTVLDCQAGRLSHADLKERVRSLAPDVVGIQAMTFTLIDAVLAARAAKEASPSAYVVLGGPHPTIYPRESVRLAGVDAVVAGEGEYAFAALLGALASGARTAGIPGVLTAGEPDAALEWRHIEDLDRILPPARHLVDNALYASPLGQGRRLTTIMTSRGCPARCIFCDRPQMGKVFRKRSAQSVVDEIERCFRDFRIEEFVVYDDTFTVDRRRVLEICRLIGERGLKVRWDIRARVDTVTPEMIEALARAGCSRVHYGVETGSPRIQKRIRKNLDLERVREVFALTRRAGMEVLGYFMVGNPDETIEDVRMTFALIRSLPMDYAHIGVFTPYPGTEIYRLALEQGVYDRDYWREFAADPRPGFAPRYWNQNFTDERLLALMKEGYRLFYARPSYLLRRALTVRSPGELWKKARLGARLLASVLRR